MTATRHWGYTGDVSLTSLRKGPKIAFIRSAAQLPEPPAVYLRDRP